MSMRKIRQIAAKEVRHILRDTRSLFIAILMPIMMTLLYGYAVNLDIKNITLAVIDHDRSVESRELVGSFYNSGYFLKAKSPPDLADPERILKVGDANAVLIIQKGFALAVNDALASRNAFSGETGSFELGMLIDGADANMSAAASSYSSIIVSRFLIEKMPPGFKLPGIKISQQVLYNPDLVSSHFFVPGLIAIILMMISALLTSVTIAREKETGTMEQLLTAPVNSRQIIIGKVLPYVGLAFLDGLLVLSFGVFHFGVPFNGSVILLMLFMCLYIITSLSLGVLISTLVKTQQLALMAAQMLTVLPSVMLSGFIFEIKNMPVILQYVTYAIPARYFLVIIRAIMLKDAGLSTLWIQAVGLIMITLILLTIASRRFKLKIG
jgi:drug efflux transport system permease protein